MSHAPLRTARLELLPITLPMVEAVFRGDRAAAEAIGDARLPEAWPGRALIERAFVGSIEEIRRAPETRLWGDRVMVTLHDRRVVGSVVFHGAPDSEGVVEIAYGVEMGSQRLGFATEGVRAAVEWALQQRAVRAVRATTAPWHAASIRVLEKTGFHQIGTRDHELLGELVGFECPVVRDAPSARLGT